MARLRCLLSIATLCFHLRGLTHLNSLQFRDFANYVKNQNSEQDLHTLVLRPQNLTASLCVLTQMMDLNTDRWMNLIHRTTIGHL